MDDLDGAPAGHWLNGEPVFNLADWLPYLHKRRRMSLASVADALRGALDADDDAAVLQLPPGRDPRAVPADWTPAVRPAAPVGPRVQRSSGRVQAHALPLRFTLHAEAPAVRQGCLRAFDALASRWRADLATGKALTRLVPGLGCGLGMTESAARRLLPELFDDGSREASDRPGQPTAAMLQFARLDIDEAAERLRSAIAACSRPTGFSKGDGWTPQVRAELLRQHEAMQEAGATEEGALIELHKAWGYAKSDRGGGSLGKVLTRARKERGRRAGRQSAIG